MKDWSLDCINEYCRENIGGRFECVLAENKGRIMIAKEAISQGEILFEEPPLHIVAEDANNEAFRTVKQLCEEDPDNFDYEPLWYWTALCSLTEGQLKPPPKVGTLPALSAQRQERLLCLYHEPVKEASDAVEKIVETLGLGVNPVAVEDLLQAWILNCFEHSEDPLGYSAYFASSFVSHSCGANAVWTEGDGDVHVVRARKNISPGDEVCISYLPEDTLLHSAEARKHSLKETKLFVCTCDRCSPSASNEHQNSDPCRGFRCPKCGECAVFHRLVCDQGEGLKGAVCTSCAHQISKSDGAKLLRMEAALEEKLKKLDTAVEKRAISKVMQDDQAQSLLRMIGDQPDGLVGPQHWLCDRLWEHLETWYKQTGRRKDQRKMLMLRVDYQRKGYQGLSGTLAWTLEREASTLLTHLGMGSGSRTPPEALDSETEKELVSRIVPICQESMQILRLMFGSEHEHFTSVKDKFEEALVFLKEREESGGLARKPSKSKAAR